MLFDTLRTIFSGGTVDLASIVMQILAVLFVIFCILPVHEYAHGKVALKLGDPTAKNMGRLTLNPLASIDPMGALFILLFGFGWAKPVMVDPRYFKKPKRDMALVSLAGPVSNLLAALAGAFVYNLILVIFKSVPLFIGIFFMYYIVINVSLAVFNLIPIPPLDGSKILAAFLPDRVLYKFYRYQNVFMMVLMLLLFSGILDYPLSIFNSAVQTGVMWLASLPFRLFCLF